VPILNVPEGIDNVVFHCGGWRWYSQETPEKPWPAGLPELRPMLLRLFSPFLFFLETACTMNALMDLS
jgi:hypothetical protein